jgi:hypothetical protein
MKLFDKHAAKKGATKDQADFYEYAVLPEELRNKIVFIMKESFSTTSTSLGDRFYFEGGENSTGWNKIIYETMKREGSFSLAETGETCGEIIFKCLLQCDVKKVLILVEEFLAEAMREGYRGLPPPLLERYREQGAPTICDKMNALFQEFRVGYEFLPDASKTIRARRIDSTYTHEKMIKPALALLRDLEFEGPSGEFNEALDEYNDQNYSNAVFSANKAFESMMKATLQELGIHFDPKAPAAKLIDVLFDQQVVPSNLQSLSGGIRTVLSSGLPTLRNVAGVGHGTGRDSQEVARSYAQFALNLCAAYLLFLEARYKERR